MMDQYFSVLEKNTSMIEIEKSKFISYIAPVESEEEANNFILEIKKLHYNATHNVSAFLLRNNNNLRRYSDDGEPSGTAGLPTLNSVIYKNLVDVCIVTTRYFGGVKLGTGGLSRAYSDSAQECIASSKIVCFKKMNKYQLIIGYEYLNPVQYYLNNKEILIDHIEYLENVQITIYIHSKNSELLAYLVNLTASNIIILEGAAYYIATSGNKILSIKEIQNEY